MPRMDDEEYYLSQIPKPQPTRLGASKVSSLLHKVIQQRGYAAVQSTELLQSAWEKAVGTELCKQTRVGNIARGALLVFVPNKVVQMELEFRKMEALKSLQSQLPDFQIRRLTIRVDR